MDFSSSKASFDGDDEYEDYDEAAVEILDAPDVFQGDEKAKDNDDTGTDNDEASKGTGDHIPVELNSRIPTERLVPLSTAARSYSFGSSLGPSAAAGELGQTSANPLTRSGSAPVARAGMVGPASQDRLVNPNPEKRSATSAGLKSASHAEGASLPKRSRGPMLSIGKTAPISRVWDGVWNGVPPNEEFRRHSWIVFSDLHVSAYSWGTCKAVLEAVHKEASEAAAGVVFLGDFWDVRGTLRVPLLNQVIDVLKHWAVPTILLVGNHDQVQLGEEDNALHPLAACNPTMLHVVSRPMYFLEALWVPFRRTADDIRAVLQHDAVRELLADKKILAMFAHLDVWGARMCAHATAKDGVRSGDLPDGIPVFTGHYHEPQTVPHAPQVCYLGSPYQVTANEEGQHKHFLLLSAQWKVKKKIPIDFGPRHFTVKVSSKDLSELEIVEPSLRASDIVDLRLTDTLTSVARERVRKLKADGVHVKIRISPVRASSSKPSIALAATPADILRQYAAQPTAAGYAHGLDMALKMLESVAKAEGPQRPTTWISFDEIQLKGLVPFLEAQSFPLQSRGIVVITGDNGEDTSTDSNGAGKTSLAFSPLWTLTGHKICGNGMKQRKQEDCVHPLSQSAAATLTGRVGSSPESAKPFQIDRLVKSGCSAQLSFALDGEPQGGGLRDKQQKIEQHLQLSLLEAAAFFTDANIEGLLDSNDKDFKGRIETALGLDVWDKPYRDAVQRRTALEHTVSKRQHEKDLLDAAIMECETTFESCSMQQQLAEIALSCETDSAMQVVHECHEAIVSLEQFQTRCHDTLAQLDAVMEEATSTGVDPMLHARPEDHCRIADASKALESVRIELEMLKTAQAAAESKVHKCEAHLASSKEAVEVFKNAFRTPEGHVGASPTCRTCGQNIDPAHAAKHLAELTAIAHEQQTNLEGALSEVKEISAQVKQSQSTLKLHEESLVSLRETIMCEARKSQLHSAEERIQKARQSKQQWGTLQKRAFEADIRLKERLANLLESVNSMCTPRVEQAHSGYPNVYRHTAAEMQLAVDVFSALADECKEAQDALLKASGHRIVIAHKTDTAKVRLQQEIAKMNKASTACDAAVEEVTNVSAACELLSRTGVRAFIVQTALTELETYCNEILEVIFDGAVEVHLGMESGGSVKAIGDDVQVKKTVRVRSSDGRMKDRSVTSLSAGERRRVGLALTFGFLTLLRRRGHMTCELLVLDEALQHLDVKGIRVVLQFLKSWEERPSTILITCQKFELLADVSVATDTVVKRGDCAVVEIGVV